MKNNLGAVFRQSLYDFPCPVVLGKRSPSFGLHRYKQGLRFIPFDDEGYTLRGDKRRLVYQGRRRSHRFTILGDTSFEYDCILEREPESNVVSLLIEGAEHFNFFRQPDFVRDPYLKGSYAVYKKQTLIGEGTGKLCHIHRPLIIDARGRRVWGELAVVGNELRITIPEMWLAGAKYPVIVDPVVGTTTVGAHYNFYNEEYDDWDNFLISEGIIVNRYTIPDNMSGNVTAYIYLFRSYTYKGKLYSNSAYIRPCIFSENNNKPYERLSANEQQLGVEYIEIDHDGWFPATFSTNRTINGGSNIWLGVRSGDFHPRFDYGAKCYMSYIDFYEDTDYGVPNIFPLNTPYYHTESGIDDNIIISIYLNYTAIQNYVRTITQGVSLPDTRRINREYKRSVAQTAAVNSLLKRVMSIYHKCRATAQNGMELHRISGLFRKYSEYIAAITRKYEIQSFVRECIETIKIGTLLNGFQKHLRKLHEDISGFDSVSSSMIFVRIKKEIARVNDGLRQWRVFLRGIRDTADNTGENIHGAEYHRIQKNTLRPHGLVLRIIFFVLIIKTRLYIRDYLLGRFLKSKTELTLKSMIVREIVLESKFND